MTFGLIYLLCLYQLGNANSSSACPVCAPVLPPERFPHAPLLSRALPVAVSESRWSSVGSLLEVRVTVQQRAGGRAVMLRSTRIAPFSHHRKL